MRRSLTRCIPLTVVAALCSASAASAAQVFVPLVPCRVADTRLGGGRLDAGETRSFQVTGASGFTAQGGQSGGCGVPADAPAVAFNLVAVGPLGAGHFEGWATGGAIPTASVLNYSPQSATGGLNIANGVIVPIATGAGPHLSVRANVSSAHLVADVTGYFVELDAGTGLTETGSGPFAFEVAGSFQLPQACTASQLAEWTGSAWACVDPPTAGGGTGTVESVLGGAGIDVDASDPANPSVAVEAGYQLPQAGCDSGEVVTSDGAGGWSCEPAPAAGTVDSVGAGTGVTVDASDPANPSVAVAAAFQLPQAGCDSGEVVTSDGTGGWSCQPDQAGAGDITAVAAGTGLTGGGTSGDVALAIDGPHALPQGCGDGQVPVWDNLNSEWDCAGSSGGVAGLSKTGLYVVTQGGSAVAAGAVATRTASCSDSNDIAVSGYCHTTGNDLMVLVSQNAVDWTTTAAAASFSCTARNADTLNTGNLQAAIVCITAN